MFCLTSIMSCILVFLFLCYEFKKYDFSHTHIFVLVYAVAIKVQQFELAYNGAYKEFLNFYLPTMLSYTRIALQLPVIF